MGKVREYGHAVTAPEDELLTPYTPKGRTIEMLRIGLGAGGRSRQ